ncbi:acetyl-CoA carboxylase biotin carboxylase subunit [Thermocrinis minervae]|uniref:Pyruvate carboxylase subunit A n=1 Tax=Thermocrinis minervae TaxID=381751 RepID=A0A1M6QW41_9AQUI|nr:acetyl-CoA carboxylase biotin carboxylase subunit [Thermocrinis minervae]SHK24308.1 pyruvate carboxylase subunit A [Thermocrinis minervae]
MFNKVLIANRGEVALRIIRACKELGIKTVAIYSEADARSLYVKKADESYLIPGDPIRAYLDYVRIVDLAKSVGADAIHPGYGFLAENAEFARYCQKMGITFIGPKPEHIETFGDKVKAKKVMQELGIPTVPGVTEPLRDYRDALHYARQIGFPVILKSAYGGGGRGMRVVKSEEELPGLFESAYREAETFFGKGDLFIEKYLDNPKHIEVQILADKYGNVVHLGERDCSVQRKHQKIIEVTPCPVLPKEIRNKMLGLSVRAMMQMGYENAGTLEFLVDLRTGEFYFIEMNTRLQVEHTITEMVTGVDIVQQMIRIAAGEPLPFTQNEITFRGYALEFRINAEDPKRNFAPSPGKITAYYSPGGPGVRMDAGVYKDFVIPPYYDSMIAKLSVWAMSWESLLARARRAIDEFIIRGVPTNIPLHREIIRDPDFISGYFGIRFLEEKLPTYDFEVEDLLDPEDLALAVAAAIAGYYGL